MNDTPQREYVPPPDSSDPLRAYEESLALDSARIEKDRKALEAREKQQRDEERKRQKDLKPKK